MASSERFSIYPASIVHAGGTLLLRQIENVRVAPGANVAAYVPGGAIMPAAHVITSANPSVSFTTKDLATVLSAVSISTGLAVTGTSTLRYQERTDAGTFASAASATDHNIITIEEGFLYPTSISASQDDEGATMELTLFPTWDGTNNPLLHVDGESIAATTPAFMDVFFLGPCYEDSVQIGGVQSVQINPGIQYSPKRFNGVPYAETGSIVRIEPTISITFLKMDDMNEADMFLRALAGTTVIYLRRGLASAARSASSDNISITIATGNSIIPDVSVSGEDDATVTIDIRPTATALAFSAAAALP